ncbi:MAG TPA: hypothetical protein VHV52_06800 [Gaiellaceae bacterium]|jgi:hypothetical protein|nr:hypothetical protein [Gaiellaceae bacterium]
MHSTYAHEDLSERTRFSRPQAVSLLGPLVAAGGVVWAVLQPYRITLLHPRGQGVWWLVAEPPLLVVIVGLLFAFVVARPLLADFQERGDTSR